MQPRATDDRTRYQRLREYDQWSRSLPNAPNSIGLTNQEAVGSDAVDARKRKLMPPYQVARAASDGREVHTPGYEVTAEELSTNDHIGAGVQATADVPPLVVHEPFHTNFMGTCTGWN